MIPAEIVSEKVFEINVNVVPTKAESKRRAADLIRLVSSFETLNALFIVKTSCGFMFL